MFGWTEDEGKVPLIAALTTTWSKKGLKAGDLVKQVAAVVGGSGGGKPDMAQAGGKDAGQAPRGDGEGAGDRTGIAEEVIRRLRRSQIEARRINSYPSILETLT